MNFKKLICWALLALSMGTLLTCSKKAMSGPQFVFKPAPDQRTAAKILGQPVTFEELNSGIKASLFSLEERMHRMKMDRLKAIIVERLVQNDPRSKNISRDEYFSKHISKGVKISKGEIEKFITEKKIPKQHINDHMRERIKHYLENEKKTKALDNWIAAKTSGKPVEVYFSRPSPPVFNISTSGAPSMGPPTAPVTLVEFSDFECPYCSKAAVTVNKLKKKYGKKLRVIFKNFPLPKHNRARLASEASLCVHEQNPKKFWPMHDKIFSDQTKMTKEDLIAHAKSLKLDMDNFKKCIDSRRYRDQVDKDIEDGKKVEVSSTPTFLLMVKS